MEVVHELVEVEDKDEHVHVTILHLDMEVDHAVVRLVVTEVVIQIRVQVRIFSIVFFLKPKEKIN